MSIISSHTFLWNPEKKIIASIHSWFALSLLSHYSIHSSSCSFYHSFVRSWVQLFLFNFVRTIAHSSILSLVHRYLFSFLSFLHSIMIVFCYFFGSFFCFFSSSFVSHFPPPPFFHLFTYPISKLSFAVCSNIRRLLLSCCGVEILGHSRTKIFIRKRKKVRGCFLIIIFSILITKFLAWIN